MAVCGGAAAYQRAAGDGFHQRVEDVDGQAQQRGPAVNDGLVPVVLEEEEPKQQLLSQSGTSPHQAQLHTHLSAVQLQVLLANLQLQNLHLVVPLLYDRGVPHWPAVQTRFSASHDLRGHAHTQSGSEAV